MFFLWNRNYIRNKYREQLMVNLNAIVDKIEVLALARTRMISMVKLAAPRTWCI